METNFPEDLTGLKFGKWIVIKFYGSKDKRKFWEVECECGNKAILKRKVLTMGLSKGCKNQCSRMKPALERLMKKTNITETCWNWTGNKDNDGYGRIYIRPKYFPTHRASWIIHFGEIPENLLVCHHCDNPSCVNPAHLFLGSNKDNCLDKVMKGRHKGSIGKKWKLKKPRDMKNG